MTPENTPENAAAATTAGGEAAAPVRRRRATRTVAVPAADTVEPTTAAAEQAATTTDTPDGTASAPKARRASTRRASTKKAAAEQHGAEQAAEQPTEQPAAGQPGADVVAAQATVETAAADETAAAEPATRPARRSRRVTRTVTVPAADAPGTTDGGAVADPAQVAPTAAPTAAADTAEPVAEAAVEAPTKPARRRRAASRPAAAAEVVEPTTPVAPADVPTAEETEEEDEDAPPAEAAPALDVLAALADVRTTEPPAVTSPRLATTALLFQAPDPSASRPRRRRAQASAGSPEAISEAARRAEHEEAERLAAEQAEQAAGHPAAEQEQTERPSRRRGRRGGRAAAVPADKPAEVDEAVAGETPEDTVPTAEDGADVEDVTTDEDDTTGDDTTGDDTTGDEQGGQRRRRRRGGRGRRSRTDAAEQDDAADEDAESEPEQQDESDEGDEGDQGGSSRRRRRRRRGSRAEGGEPAERPRGRSASDEVTALRGSTRLEAKRQRRREGRDAGRRRQIITESEFLARRESVERTMVVRERAGRTQIGVLEDGVLVEHYVSNQAQTSMVGNVYLGRVQNVLPSMEAAFVDVGKGRNAVLYAGEVNWDAAGLEGQPRRIEQALKSGDSVLVQVTKDPIGHKGARLTSQVTLAGRYLVYVPGGGMTGISRKLPDIERNRLKKILREVVPDSAGVIVRTAAEGASEEELRADIARLQGQWEAIEKKSRTASAPALLQGEPDMAIRVVRDIFNDDFSALVVQGDEAWSTISSYIDELAPDLAKKVSKWTGTQDVFTVHRVDEQLAKGMDRKVWLPSGGSLVIDRTEAMTVVDVNTGKFTGSGGTLEETVTRNNLEAAEEIVRQLRLRDIGGIIVIDFIDMVLESNRDLVLRRLVECLGRDRTKHQVAEVTSLGLVQMTRKRVGQGLVEAFSETCEHCHGRGFIVHDEPVEKNGRPDAGAPQPAATEGESKRSRRKRGAKEPAVAAPHPGVPVLPEAREAVKATLATIAAAAAHAHEHDHHHEDAPVTQAVADLDAGEAEQAVTRAVPAEGIAIDVAVVEELGAGDASQAPAAEAPAAPAAFDVLAALAASGVARDDAAPVVSDDTEPDAEPDAEPASVAVEPTEDPSLELTPVSPDVFADAAADEDDEDETDEAEGADPTA